MVSIFSDGPTITVPDDGCLVYRNSPELGNFRNWVRAVTGIYETTKAEWLMVLEDDVVWARGAFKAIDEEIRREVLSSLPALGAISLYFPARMASPLEKVRGFPLPRGFHCEHMQVGLKMWGAQAMMIERGMVQSLLQSKGLEHFLRSTRDKNVDGIVCDVLNGMGRKVYWRVPCLVDHTPLGEANSSLGYPNERPQLRTRYFTGKP